MGARMNPDTDPDVIQAIATNYAELLRLKKVVREQAAELVALRAELGDLKAERQGTGSSNRPANGQARPGRPPSRCGGEIVRLLREKPSYYTDIRDAMEERGISETTVRRSLNSLADLGVIEKNGREGPYQLAENGHA